MTKIAFIGLGNMGGSMAVNLAKAGHSVIGFDLDASSCAAVSAKGVEIAPDALAGVGGAEVVITMLPAGKHVVAVWSDVISAAKPGALFIDSSTIDVVSARELHALAASQNIHSLDAPVSGGVGGAQAATLTFMVGGAADAFARGKPFLEQMGKRVVHCGDAGSGQTAKICNNMILGISMIAVSEAFVLAEKLGLSHQALFDVTSTSSGQCWALNSYCPVPGPVPASPANNGYKPGFSAALMSKDLDLAQVTSRAAGVETTLGRNAAALYSQFNRDGGGSSDFSAIIELVRAHPPDNIRRNNRPTNQ